MTPQEFARYIRIQTRTTAATFTDADILLLANAHKNDIVARALQADEDIFLMDMTRNLEAGVRDYSFPDDAMPRLKRVECNFTGGSTEGSWIPLNELDLTKYKRGTDEATILANFANEKGKCFYDIYRKMLRIYSGAIIEVVGGLKLWMNIYPSDIANLTEAVVDMATDPSATAHGIPKELHLVIATEVIKDYKSSREKPLPLSQTELANDKKIEQAIKILSNQNTDRVITMDIPDASDRGDNGYNY